VYSSFHLDCVITEVMNYVTTGIAFLSILF